MMTIPSETDMMLASKSKQRRGQQWTDEDSSWQEGITNNFEAIIIAMVNKDTLLSYLTLHCI